MKTVEQQTLQALHRVRTQWQAARTARINVVRGLLREQGLPVGVGARTVLTRVSRASSRTPTVAAPGSCSGTLVVARSSKKSARSRRGLPPIDQQLARVAREHPVARRLQQVPGVGMLTATAFVGAVNHIHAFRRGRDFASWLGLTPRESSTGDRRYLGRISKRGDVYLRCLLTHGARAVLLSAQRTARATPQRVTRLQHWAVERGGQTGPQQGGDCRGQQTGSDHLGRLASRESIFNRTPPDDGSLKEGTYRRDAQRGLTIMA